MSTEAYGSPREEKLSSKECLIGLGVALFCGFSSLLTGLCIGFCGAVREKLASHCLFAVAAVLDREKN